MNEAARLFFIFLGAALINNILLIRFIALCPFFGVSKKVEVSIGMGLAVIFVMTLATSASWMVYYWILVPLGIGEFLYITTFILVIASLVQLVEVFIKKTSPVLFRAMGIYLPLITTNCAVLAAATESVKPGFLTMNIPYHYSFLEANIYTLGVSVGFTVILITFAGIRERLEFAPIPPFLEGTPIAFVTAALMSLAFMGFAGLFNI